MKAEERTISQVLTEQFRYEIPPYQRPYSWGTEQAQDLLQDVEEAYENNDKEYFIGSLITIERKTNELYEVVDGQQRLTTLNLIFSRFREKIENSDAKQEIGKRILPRNPLTGQTETPRLTLRKRDQIFFRDHVLEAKPFDDSKLGDLEAPKANMIRNMATVDAFLKDRSQDWLKLFANYILQNVYVVVVKTESFQSAYRLFNVLNARGLDLSNADLIKNQLFSKLAENDARRNELEDLWVELEETADIENLDTFLGNHRTALVAEKARKSLAEEFEAIIVNDKNSPLDYLKGLIASAKNYDKINEDDLSDPEALRSLAALKRVTYDEWIPALLAYLNKPVAGLSEGEFVALLEKITMQNWVRRLGRTKRNTIYYRLITGINKAETADQIKKVFRDGANNEEVLTLLRGDVYGLSSAQAILLRLEEGMQDVSVTKTYGGSLTIEHVLPQALKETYWIERFSTEEHQKWLHKLGNITLLCGKKNSKAQYYDFPKKKAIYLKRNEKVSFDLTKEICEEADWTIAEIEKRQKRLIEVAEKLWKIE
jgi:uncharacterized protein with ParB-like and HNH nuclease domain